MNRETLERERLDVKAIKAMVFQANMDAVYGALSHYPQESEGRVDLDGSLLAHVHNDRVCIVRGSSLLGEVIRYGDDVVRSFKLYDGGAVVDAEALCSSVRGMVDSEANFRRIREDYRNSLAQAWGRNNGMK